MLEDRITAQVKCYFDAGNVSGHKFSGDEIHEKINQDPINITYWMLRAEFTITKCKSIISELFRRYKEVEEALKKAAGASAAASAGKKPGKKW